MTRSKRALPTVVLCTVSSDAHTWNLVYLELLLREHDFAVVKLGACTPSDLVLEAVLEHRPVAVVVSTVNGHGEVDAIRLARRLRAGETGRRTPLIVGGKLGIAGRHTSHRDAALREAGFDLVFGDHAEPRELVESLHRMCALAGAVGSAP